ncbi:MAG: PAS domain S-box protein [Thermoanaerobaculia bacterium]
MPVSVSALRRGIGSWWRRFRRSPSSTASESPELTEESASYRDLVENSLGLICTHDLSGRLLSINPAGASLFGFSPAEVVGRSLREALSPSVQPLFDEYLSRLRDLTTDSGYMRVRVPGGEERVLYYRNRLCQRPGREPYVLGHAQDLTEQFRAERAEKMLANQLRESDARYRSLFEEAPVGIYRTTPDGQILLVNPALLRMLGYDSAAPLQARNLQKQETDASYDRALFRELVEREEGIRGLESQWRRRDGSMIWVREHAKAVRGDDGAVLYYEGTVEDISGPKRAQEELLASHARRAAIVEAALDGVLTLDAAGRIFEFNPAAERVLGWLPEEALGRNVLDLLDLPGFCAAEHGELESYLASGAGVALGRRIETQGRRADGAVFPLELALTRLPGNNPATFTAFVRDLSERQEIERLKAQFVATVSHELRTPLTSLRGALGLLAGGVLGDLPPEARSAVEIAQRSILRLVSLVNDILDIERLEHGRLSLQLASHSLAALLARSVEEVSPIAREAGIALDVGHPQGALVGDGDRLVQVIVNLLSNALKFSPRGSAVRLRAWETPDGVEVQVEDQGRGVPPSQREVIFDRFRQVEIADSAGQRGAGLGLAIARSIVEMHGGRIGVESEPGKGSTFWFRIPRGPEGHAM